MDVDYLNGSPDTTWYMGANSTDGTHNSQIYFTVPPLSSIAAIAGVALASIAKFCGIAIADIEAVAGVSNTS